jgi:hypothetical protein
VRNDARSASGVAADALRLALVAPSTQSAVTPLRFAMSSIAASMVPSHA